MSLRSAACAGQLAEHRIADVARYAGHQERYLTNSSLGSHELLTRVESPLLKRSPRKL
ncbi:MAG TPA: hypothetical protein VFO16_00260 [Pseudonocardiaceae bacterium]|nr:hypothetical protein [Pseudonocardiaceae bacterium]